jgi:hypothetical protein
VSGRKAILKATYKLNTINNAILHITQQSDFEIHNFSQKPLLGLLQNVEISSGFLYF